MERCPPPSGRRLMFSACNNLYRKIIGLLHASQVQRKTRYFIHCSHRDIELDYESDIDEFGPKNRHERFKKSWLIRESYEVIYVLMFSIFMLLKNAR